MEQLAQARPSTTTAALPADTPVRVKLALSPHEREQARALRRQVFCQEQGIFQEDDGDALDAVAMPLVAVLEHSGEVVGTVRIHESAPGVWQGSRLAVARPWRRVAAIGSGLIRLAVSTAHAHGCQRFLAQVQSQNVPLFERLHWTSLEQLDVHGRPHHLMCADLAFYAPISDGEVGFVVMPGAKT